MPDESPEDEIGLEHEVVLNSAIRGMILPPSLAATGPEPRANPMTQESETEREEIPRGYVEEVASLLTIEPGGEMLFSVPTNHLSKRWHTELAFEFELPKGKGPREVKTGAGPVLKVHDTPWDLPRQSQKLVGKK